MEKRIDVHTHILPPKIPKFKEKFGYGGFIELQPCGACSAKMVRDDGTHFRDIESNSWDPIQRITECDRDGVTVQVLSTVPIMFSYFAKPKDGAEVCRFVNDHIADIASKYPERFIGLGSVPLQDMDLATEELERCVKELGLPGVEIGTHVNGKNLGDEEFFPFFKRAQELGAPIFIHPWDMMGGDSRLKKFWLSWLIGMPTEVAIAAASMTLSGLFQKLPSLRVCFAHGGGAYGGILGRIEKGYSCRPDLVATESSISPRAQLGSFYVDSLTHDPAMLKHVISLFGMGRVMLGSDYPFPLGEDRPGEMISLMSEIGAKEKEKLLWRNAWEWLGIDGDAR